MSTTQTEKPKLWVVYLTSLDDTKDKTIVTAYKNRNEAFECMFDSGADSAYCTEMTIGEPTAGIQYSQKGDEIWLMDQHRGQIDLVATKHKDDTQKIVADKATLDAEVKESKLRIAILRSLLNLQATQRGEKSSFGENILKHSEFKPISYYTSNLKPGTYHKTILNDIVEIEDTNSKLATWILDLIALTGYKGSVASLAEKSKWYQTYDPTIPFPADLEALKANSCV